MAANDEYADGFFVWSDNAALMFNGSELVNVLQGYFPATFSGPAEQDIGAPNRSYLISSSSLPHNGGVVSWYSDVNFYVEVLFSVPSPVTVSVTADPSGQSPTIASYLTLTKNPSADVPAGYDLEYSNDIDISIDGVLSDLTGSTMFDIPVQDFDVSHYWGYRFYFPTFNHTANIGESNSEVVLQLGWSELFVNYQFSGSSSGGGIYDQVVVNTGILREISGSVEDIRISTSQIQSDVSEIKDGLQDSNSGIWGAFKDSVSGLLVPSADDLAGVKDGFDQLAQDKLGGAYQSFDVVINGVQTISDKLKNPGESPGVEFPGISVPLGGDVGTVSLAASQTVMLPEKITGVLYPVAGVIIPIVCAIWTIRQCLEMLEYFMSGMSYAEYHNRYLHEEDE